MQEHHQIDFLRIRPVSIRVLRNLREIHRNRAVPEQLYSAHGDLRFSVSG